MHLKNLNNILVVINCISIGYKRFSYPLPHINKADSLRDLDFPFDIDSTVFIVGYSVVDFFF